MRRALFFPWSAGGGAGYTCRCLALAARIASEYSCAFGPEALPRLVEEAGFPLAGSRLRMTSRLPRHDFLPFANVERVYAVAARYYRTERVREHVQRDRRAIEEHRPDIVIVDMQPTAAIAARSLGVPVLSIADADFLSPSHRAWMPWLTLAPDALLPQPSCVPAFNEVLAELALAPIASPTRLLWGDVTIVPSCSELEPVCAAPTGVREAVHIGPLYWDPPAASPKLPPKDGSAIRVYVTIGSGGMISERILGRVFEALANTDVTVFVSTGIDPPVGVNSAANVHVGGFTGLTQAVQWSDVVVTHGGYSSVIATTFLGRPQIVLPLMSEQEANARQMVELPGCGVLVRRTRTDLGGRRVRYINRYSGETDDPVPAREDILASVYEVLRDRSFTERVAVMSQRLTRAQRACDLLGLLDDAQT